MAQTFSRWEVLRLRSGSRQRAQTPAQRLDFDASSLASLHSDSLSMTGTKERPCFVSLKRGQDLASRLLLLWLRSLRQLRTPVIPLTSPRLLPFLAQHS